MIAAAFIVSGTMLFNREQRTTVVAPQGSITERSRGEDRLGFAANWHKDISPNSDPQPLSPTAASSHPDDAPRLPQGTLTADEWRVFVEKRLSLRLIVPTGFRLAGRCDVSITQEPDGRLIGAHLERCGEEYPVQQAILAAVYRAQPYPRPPPGAGVVSCCSVR